MSSKTDYKWLYLSLSLLFLSLRGTQTIPLPTTDFRNTREGIRGKELALTDLSNIDPIRENRSTAKRDPNKHNPIQKMFMSDKVDLDRNTLQKIEADIQNPESFRDRVLEVTTFIEGDMEPDDNFKVTTRIRDYKNEEITYITPSFEKIDGRLNYSHSVLQEENEGVFRIRGASKTNVNGEGNLGLHIQQFETEREGDNKMLFGKYAAFLQTYIEYLYKYNVDIKSEHLKDLQASFVYFGSLANGEDPSLESTYSTDFSKLRPTKDAVYETVTGTEGKEDSTISYGVSNKNNDSGGHAFQNLVATASGADSLSGLQLQVFEAEKFIRGSIVGQATAKPSGENSMTTVDAVGNNAGLGFSDNTTFSKQKDNLLATASEIKNLSIGEEALGGESVVVDFEPAEKVLPGAFLPTQVLVGGHQNN